MVHRVTKYSDGGGVEYEKPTYFGAVKDRIKEFLPGSGRKVLVGDTGNAADQIAANRDRASADKMDKIENGYKNGGVVKPNGKYC